jgi:hypothetical protein
MKPALRDALQTEREAARRHEAEGALDLAFAHLERAHILSQRHAIAHAGVHVGMLRVGWKRRDRREVAGQVPRIVAALLFSRVWIPVGNTGGANVGALRPMPLPDDLRAILESD